MGDQGKLVRTHAYEALDAIGPVQQLKELGFKD